MTNNSATNNPATNNPATNNAATSNPAARLGILIGAICSIIGTAAGFYVGILKPALDRGGALNLPVPLLALSLGLLAIALYCIVRVLRKPINNSAKHW